MSRITINIATYPLRKQGFSKRVRELAPQCDLLRVYLNGYRNWPSYMPRPDNVEFICGDGVQAPDLGSQGKLFWLDPSVDEYYLTCDDDIAYAPDYAKHMIDGCVRYGNQAVVSLHGGTFVMPRREIPRNIQPRQLRKLLSYRKKVDTDTAVMLGGNGIMCCHPMTLGLSKAELITGPVHSGDDEDIAIWCQKNRVAIVVLKHDVGMAVPDYNVFKINAQYCNPECVKKQNTKLRAWKDWFLTPAPCELKLFKTEKRRMHPEFKDIDLTQEQLGFTNKTLDSDSLAAQLITRVKHFQPTSIIRMGDGERGLIEYGKGGPPPWFLKDTAWVREYGLDGANFRELGCALLTAGAEADYLGPSIASLFREDFNVAKYFLQREQFVPVFFVSLMNCTGRWDVLLHLAPVIVLHRHHTIVAQQLKKKYGLVSVMSYALDNMKDQPGIAEALLSVPYSIVLVSGGPAGKPWMVNLARETGHCVIDVGSDMNYTLVAGAPQ